MSESNRLPDVADATIAPRGSGMRYMLPAILVLLLGLPSEGGTAPAPDCQPLCRVTCLKPIAIPDRWDDETLVANYYEWQSNGFYDQEDYSDLNGDRLYNLGEPFNDGNSDGVYNQESYNPDFTGYMAGRNLGDHIPLKASSGLKPSPSVYAPLALPGADYAWQWPNCQPATLGVGDVLPLESGDVLGPTIQALRRIKDQDPNAVWDEVCECVIGSDFRESPRLFVVAAHDPRIRLTSGNLTLPMTKLLAVFIEDIYSSGEISIRLAELTQATGEACEHGVQIDGGFVFGCDPVQVQATTWGRIKAIHR